MKNDKISITYEYKETRELNCWPPHSKYILEKNIGLIIFFMLSWFAMGLVATKVFYDISMTIFFIFTGLIVIGTSIYCTIDEWYNGKDYKNVISIMQKHATSEEIKEAFEKLHYE